MLRRIGERGAEGARVKGGGVGWNSWWECVSGKEGGRWQARGAWLLPLPLRCS